MNDQPNNFKYPTLIWGPERAKMWLVFESYDGGDFSLTIMGDFFWDDLGSWNAFERYLKKDENNNACKGNSISVTGNSRARIPVFTTTATQ